ncbi:MAG: fatty-acid oxidation protein subunit alpha [Symploca sp. SIO3C6]|uniref:Fatty-acid oxidation protein subunit alpha n=1 Tax=Symploca sp. SIO1C4 TaxID=2607765 RepID=A0A6B3NJX0_9CYAN|nr:fatty-acid oxidation protein subunit alpha [Symploca sp. SIO3C6]NER29518.1 fatty-acid oxidation protein subunit alpha [Symploca sp. SIO1C4]NET03747.1 fatty-acid oxidation protein subunit alpha [Symploca sp. SIO2B6]
MSARDVFHNAVKAALRKDGWTITNDPLYLRLGDDQLRIDLAAERLIAAERGHQKIAVEVKSFLAPSAVAEFHTALGQFLNYRAVLQVQQPERKLYLAVTADIYQSFFRRDLPQLSIQTYQLKLISFEPVTEVIVQWID